MIVFGKNANSAMLDLIERAITEQPQADLIVVCDPNDPARRSSLRGELPPLLSLLAASMTGDPAVAVSAKALREQAASAPDGTGLQGLTMRVAVSGNVLFVESDFSPTSPSRLWPSLTMPASEPTATRLRDCLVSLPLPTARPNSPDTVALRAGLLLLNDFFDESHSCSQLMEGQQNADYWHAILHRREPDYGNAKYWFHHVGRHAIFHELASSVSSADISSSTPSAAACPMMVAVVIRPPWYARSWSWSVPGSWSGYPLSAFRFALPLRQRGVSRCGVSQQQHSTAPAPAVGIGNIHCFP